MNHLTSGKSYRSLLQERRGRGFSEAEVHDLLRRILIQLTTLHSQGLSHGAISLDTLIQDSISQQPLLLAYPESTVFQPPTHTDDLYALGVTMVVLLTSQSPEMLSNLDGFWNWQDHCLVSDQFGAILEKAIASPSHLRYSNAIEMTHALNLLTQVAMLPLSSHHVNTPQSSPLSVPYWQYSAFCGGIIALIGIGGFSLFSLLNSKSPAIIPAAVSSPQNSIDPSASVSPTVESSSLIANSPRNSDASPDITSSIQSQPSPVQNFFIHDPQTVQFAAGATGAVIQGDISSYQIKPYLLNCQAGQRFAVRLSQGDLTVTVMTPSQQVLGLVTSSSPQWEGTLPTSGDYVIRVESLRETNYAVSVDVL
jgi:serine/threonine protein kinase